MSANPARPSHFVAAFLASKGYRVVGVNPGLAGQTMLGEPVHASLTDIPFDIDMVDIFRVSDDVPPVVDEALARFPDLKAIWMQVGITNPAAAAKARARGVMVVEDRCPKVEHPRLIG
jgi:predicted CoA-binding protein